MNRPPLSSLLFRLSSRPASAPRRLALAMAACSLFTLEPCLAQAQTLPTGLTVAAGLAQVSTQGNSMTVKNTPNAILNWRSFSIGAQNTVRFDQVDAASKVLNRVTGSDPSQILGQLSSNGQVWLLNPNGVLFGAGARVDVASLVTSTLALQDKDWLAGRYSFTAPSSAPVADVVNQGEIRSALGGRVLLLGGTVRNEGVIDATGGQVLLAAGQSIELVDTGAPHLTVKLTAPSGEALNLGTLSAAGGRIDVHAALVNQQGIVRADSLSAGPGGEIVLQAGERLNLAAGSVTSASAATGDGGRVKLLGREVGLFGSALVEAAGGGAGNGGEVLVGGGQQGKDASVPNAQAVYFGREALIRADAGALGNGGRIILWSDAATRAFGSLSAQGGAQGGDGGFIETSGGWLDARPLTINVSSVKGHFGQWLLDPHNILIAYDPSAQDFGLDANFTAVSDNAVIRPQTIVDALNLGTNVTLDTGTTGSQPGSITAGGVNITVTGAAPGTFSLLAAGDITVVGSLIQSQNPMNVNFLAGRGSTQGHILIDASTIIAAGGDVVLGGYATSPTSPMGIVVNQAAVATVNDAVHISASTINARDLKIAGTSSGGRGVSIEDGSVPSILRGRNITISGSSSVAEGLAIINSKLELTTGSMTLTGATTGPGGTGLLVSGASNLTASPGIQSSGSQLLLRGDAFDVQPGVWVNVNDAGSVQVGNGTALSINGSNQSSGSNWAVEITGRLTAGSGSEMDVAATTNGNSLLLQGASLTGSSAGIRVAALGGSPPNDSLLRTAASTISAPGQIQLAGHLIDLESGTLISSNRPSGDSILVTTSSGNPVTSFINNAGSGALSTSGGRYIIYINDATDATKLALGGLSYDFTRHGVAAPVDLSGGPNAWDLDIGNGIVSAAFQTVVITGDVATRPYNGGAGATVTNLAGTGANAVALFNNPVYQFTTKDAGANKLLALTSGSFSMSDGLGKPVYGMGVQNNLRGTISPATVTGSVTVADKIYDQSTAATVTVNNLTGLVGNETLGFVSSGDFANKNVGQNKPVTGHFILTNGSDGNGGLAANYVFNSPNLTASITPAQLLINGINAANKVYDTTTTATLSGTPTVVPFAGDSVALNGSVTGNFQDKNVGSNKPVSVSGLSLGGTDAGNYLLIAPTGLVASINAAVFNPGIVAVSKVYDGTTDANVVVTSAKGVNGEVLTVNPFGVYTDSKDVGKNKPVLGGYTIVDGPTGDRASNYTVVAFERGFSGIPLNADITPATLNLSGLTASNKVYDRSLAASLSGTPVLSGVFGQDAVGLSGLAQASFADKNVGIAKPVSVSAGLTGTDAGNYVLAKPALTADITPASLLVSGIKANPKTYDATTLVTISGTASVTPIAGDSVTVSGGSYQFISKNAGQRAVSASGYTLQGADAGNYVVTPPQTLSALISPAALSLAGLSTQDKVYDGNTGATISGTATLGGVLRADNVTLLSGVGGFSGHFDDKNVGNAKPVSLAGSEVGIGGSDASNYVLSLPVLAASITPATLTLAGYTANSKVYDTTTGATLSGSAQLSGLLAADRITLVGAPSGAGSFADKNVGAAKVVTVDLGDFGIGGPDAKNYVVNVPTLRADISPATLQVSGLAANNKVYDRTTTATLRGTPTIAALGTDQVILSGAVPGAFFSDKNVGTGKAVSFGDVAPPSLGGPNAGNYIAQWPSNLRADITPFNLSLINATALNKVYDGTINATLSGQPGINPLPGDQVRLTFSGGGPVFSDKNVGTAKPVNIGNIVLIGADAGNYVAPSTTGLRADITPAPLQVSGLSANGKTYDATRLATLGGTASVTPLLGDVVSVNGAIAGQFADKNVGTAKPVTLSGLSLTGADAGNYTPIAPGLSASITPASLVVSGLSALDKGYDATTAATLFGTAALGGVIGADNVTLQRSFSGRFQDKNAGSNKPVSLRESGVGLGGADGANYTLSLPALSASITLATLTVGGFTTSNKVYDATTNATLNGSVVLSGVLGGDQITLTGAPAGTASFADKNVGVGKTVTINRSDFGIGGVDAGNYVVRLPTLQADITPASLTLAGLNASNKIYDGTTIATMNGTATLLRVLPGDQVAVTGSPAAQFSDRNVGTNINVQLTGSIALSGADAGNYNLSSGGYSASIAPATLSYVADAVSKPLNDAVPGLTGKITGFVPGETVASATTGSLSFSTPATAATPVGSYAIDGQGLAARNYQFQQAPSNATALTITAPPTAAAPTTLDQSTKVALNSVTTPATTPPVASISAGLLDLTEAPGAGNVGTSASTAALAATMAQATAPTFAPIRVSDMSMDALAALLASRDKYKQTLFAEAISKLQKDPTLADAHVCSSLKEAEAGTCLVTDELKRESKAVLQAGAVAAVATPAPESSPRASASANASASASAAPQAEVVAARALSLPSRRHVRVAALPAIERKVAVVVGVDDYADRTIPTLGNAINDAQAVGKLFESNLGYETVVIPNATKADVISTLNRLALAMGPKDSVVIYYAGHGDVVESTGQGYWMLSDADAKKPETWLSNADIGRLIAQIGASQVALISDSCYSGSLVSSDQRIRASSTAIDPAQLLERKSVVVMSSGGNEPVSDAGKQGHSPFTWNLMNQLSQVNKWQAGGNVFERVRFAVARELPQRPQYGASGLAGHQPGGDYLFEQRQLEARN